MPNGYDCDVCAERFNDTIRLPKLLPCQHTFCLECLHYMNANGSVTCPVDKKVFAVDVTNELPDSSLYIKGRMENGAGDGERPQKRLRGYSDVNAEADGENLQLRLLESLATRREELLAALRAVRDGVLAALQERVQAEEKLLKRARDCIECLQGEEQQPRARAAPQLRREAASLLRAGVELDQDLKLLQPRLASMSAEGGWRSKRVQLSEQPALQLAALQLRQQDCLYWKPSQQKQQQGEESQQEPQAEQEVSTSHFRLNVDRITWESPSELTNEKEELLCATAPLHMLTYVWCKNDPELSLSLLRKHAAHLEELHLYYAGRPHLLAVQSMRRLRRLQVRRVCADCLATLPAQSPGEEEEEDSGLTWLQLLEVPRDTARSLIAANAHSLRKLRLGVGPPSKELQEDPPVAGWLSHCDDLEDFLRDCELKRLEGLSLVRSEMCRVPALCEEQLAKALRVLPPNCRVRCTVCRVWVDGAC